MENDRKFKITYIGSGAVQSITVRASSILQVAEEYKCWEVIKIEDCGA